MYVFQVFSPASVIFAGIGVFLAVSVLSVSTSGEVSRRASNRLPRVLRRVKTFSQSCLNALDIFSRDLKHTQTCHRLRL